MAKIRPIWSPWLHVATHKLDRLYLLRVKNLQRTDFEIEFRQRRLRWLDQMVDFYEDLIEQAIQMTREGASVERIGNLLSYRIRNPPRF
jgi:hypothetical protein